MSRTMLAMRVEIYAEMLFRRVIIRVGIFDYYRVDDVTIPSYRRYFVEVRCLAVYGFEVWKVVLLHVDHIVIIVAAGVSYYHIEGVFRLHIAYGEIEIGG